MQRPMVTTRAGSLPDCRPLLADSDDLTLVFQPIVDLAGARVAGYAALPRFPGTASPEVWLAAARDAGLDAPLQALTVHKALAAVPDLPTGTFLVVDVAADLLRKPSVWQAFAVLPGLAGLAVRLLGSVRAGDVAVLDRVRQLQARGALLVSDGPLGAGPEAPDLVSLPVAGDGALSAERAGPLVQEAGRSGARVVAEGLATPQDLAAAVRLGVPLGRGWLLAPPAPAFTRLGAEARTLVGVHAARARRDRSVGQVARPLRRVPVGEPVDAGPALLLDDAGEPVALVLVDAGGLRTAALFPAVPASAGMAETLQLALDRPRARRLDPLAVTDAAGGIVGLVRVQDLLGGR